MSGKGNGVRKPATTLPHLRKKQQVRATAVRGQAALKPRGK